MGAVCEAGMKEPLVEKMESKSADGGGGDRRCSSEPGGGPRRGQPVCMAPAGLGWTTSRNGHCLDWVAPRYLGTRRFLGTGGTAWPPVTCASVVARLRLIAVVAEPSLHDGGLLSMCVCGKGLRGTWHTTAPRRGTALAAAANGARRRGVIMYEGLARALHPTRRQGLLVIEAPHRRGSKKGTRPNRQWEGDVAGVWVCVGAEREGAGGVERRVRVWHPARCCRANPRPTAVASETPAQWGQRSLHTRGACGVWGERGGRA